MNGETYRNLLDRIASAMLASELDALLHHVLECAGASPRRRALLHAIEERRGQLENA